MANAELNVILSADGKQLATTVQKAEKDIKSLESTVVILPKAFQKVDGAISKLQSTVAKFGGGVKTFNKTNIDLLKGLKATDVQVTKSSQTMVAAAAAVGKSRNKYLELSRVIQDLPFGFTAISNNLTQLIPGVGLAGIAFSGLVAALTFSQIGLRGWGAGAKKAGEDAKESAAGVSILEEQQKHFTDAVNSAAASVVGEAKDLADLRDILLATAKANVQLTDSTIKQGLARFIFDEKNVELQKILSAEIEKQILLRKRSVGVGGLEEFKTDEQTEGLRRFSKSLIDLGKADPGLIKDVKRLDELNKLLQQTGGSVNFLNELGKGLGGFFKDFLDDGKDADKSLDDIISRAKKLAAFLQKTTIRNVVFELDPELTKVEQAGEARKFIERALTARETFEFKPQVLIDGIDLKPTQGYFDGLKKSAEKITKDLQEEVKKLTATNPILIESKRVEDTNKARGAEFFQALGIPGADENAPKSLLTEAQKEAVNLANTMNQVVMPAFQSFFDALRSGENPIKAFFQTIGQAVEQFIQKLIQAAIQAAILSAISGGASSFSGAFKSILGFRAEGGPVFANRPYVVGERGPELFIPQGGGRIVPNNEMNTGLAGVTGGSMAIEVVGRISGRDISLSGARQGRFNNRNV